MAAKIRAQIAQQIVETVKDFCGHDINFIDGNGTIFASTNPERVGTFHEIGKAVITQGKTIDVTADNSFSGTRRGLNIPVSYHGEIVAAIGISGDPQQVSIYAQLACKITRLILRENELEAQRSSRKQSLNYCLQTLVNGNPLDHDFLINVLRQYSTDEEDVFRAAVVRTTDQYNPSRQPTLEQEIFQMFQATGTKLYTFIFPCTYLLCLPADQLHIFCRRASQLIQAYPGIFQIGVGTAATLPTIHHSYQEAEIALHSLSGEKSMAVFDDLDLDILLSTISESKKTLFLEKARRNLDEQDLQLLKTYFANNLSLKDTAGALFLHKNTIQYQLDRIWKRTGYNPRVFQDAVVLYLGTKLS